MDRQPSEDEDERARAAEEPEWMSAGSKIVAAQSSRGAGAGVQFGAAIVVFTLGGLWVDRRLDTVPLFLLLGLGLGFTGGLIHLMRTLGGRSTRKGPVGAHGKGAHGREPRGDGPQPPPASN